MVDYHILAERLVNLHTSLHPVPINQELTALNRGTFFALNYLCSIIIPRIPRI